MWFWYPVVTLYVWGVDKLCSVKQEKILNEIGLELDLNWKQNSQTKVNTNSLWFFFNKEMHIVYCDLHKIWWQPKTNKKQIKHLFWKIYTYVLDSVKVIEACTRTYTFKRQQPDWPWHKEQVPGHASLTSDTVWHLSFSRGQKGLRSRHNLSNEKKLSSIRKSPRDRLHCMHW